MTFLPTQLNGYSDSLLLTILGFYPSERILLIIGYMDLLGNSPKSGHLINVLREFFRSTTPRDHPGLRRFLQSALVLTIVLFVLAFVRFPLPANEAWISIGFTLAIGVFISFGIWFALRRTHTHMLVAEQSVHVGQAAGVILSLVWSGYILYTHLGLDLARKATIGNTLTLLTFLITAILLFGAGFVCTYWVNQLRAGIFSGLWAGLIAGLVNVMVLIAKLEFFMSLLIQKMNPGELQAFAQSGWQDRAIWYFWREEFLGSVMYFPLEVVMGFFFGLLGGAAGWLARRLIHHPG